MKLFKFWALYGLAAMSLSTMLGCDFPRPAAAPHSPHPLIAAVATRQSPMVGSANKTYVACNSWSFDKIPEPLLNESLREYKGGCAHCSPWRMEKYQNGVWIVRFANVNLDYYTPSPAMIHMRNVLGGSSVHVGGPCFLYIVP